MTTDAWPCGLDECLAASARLGHGTADGTASADAFRPTSIWVWPVPCLGDRLPVIAGRRVGGEQAANGRVHRCLGADIMYERDHEHDLGTPFPPGTLHGTHRHFMPDHIPALAASDGVVRLTRCGARGFSIVIGHANRWATYYAHLEGLSVTPEQVVATGQPIGRIGHDPTAARPVRHLHFELWRDGRRRGAVDPEPYLAAWRSLTLPSWSTSAIRNSRLIYRPVGLRGEPYPDWLRGLKGKSGAYVIREEGRPVYIGESHTGRLYETLTRHFQTWRRQKGFWKGYVEGHDPGLTYDRDGVHVAVRVTSASDAIDEELRLIERLRPRDNLLGQPEAEEVPF